MNSKCLIVVFIYISSCCFSQECYDFFNLARPHNLYGHSKVKSIGLQANSIASPGSGFNITFSPVIQYKRHAITIGPKMLAHNRRFLHKRYPYSFQYRKLDQRLGLYGAYQYYIFPKVARSLDFFLSLEAMYGWLKGNLWVQDEGIQSNLEARTLELASSLGFNYYPFRGLYPLTRLYFTSALGLSINRYYNVDNPNNIGIVTTTYNKGKPTNTKTEFNIPSNYFVKAGIGYNF